MNKLFDLFNVTGWLNADDAFVGTCVFGPCVCPGETFACCILWVYEAVSALWMKSEITHIYHKYNRWKKMIIQFSLVVFFSYDAVKSIGDCCSSSTKSQFTRDLFSGHGRQYFPGIFGKLFRVLYRGNRFRLMVIDFKLVVDCSQVAANKKPDWIYTANRIPYKIAIIYVLSLDCRSCLHAGQLWWCGNAI